MSYLSIILIIVVMVVIASILFVFFATSSSEEEQPELIIQTKTSLRQDDEDDFRIILEAVNVDINGENNLDKVYVIHADNRVERLNAEYRKISADIEKIIENVFSGVDLHTEMYDYSYCYILMKWKDGNSKLYLYYFKASVDEEPMSVVTGCVSEVDLYEWTHGHEADKAYEGERIVAEQYMEIVHYLGQLIY